MVDADGHALPSGDIGEIVCRGDVVMSGYWNNPKATAETLRDGWLYTGDMGSFDDRGYLTLRDRSKDVVITGGSNVYPREVEEVLLRHRRRVRRPVLSARLTLNGARSSSPLSCWTSRQHCQHRVNSMPIATTTSLRFKRPKRYVFVDIVAEE